MVEAIEITSHLQVTFPDAKPAKAFSSWVTKRPARNSSTTPRRPSRSIQCSPPTRKDATLALNLGHSWLHPLCLKRTRHGPCFHMMIAFHWPAIQPTTMEWKETHCTFLSFLTVPNQQHGPSPIFFTTQQHYSPPII